MTDGTVTDGTVTDWGAMSLLDAAWSALGEHPDHLAAVQRRGHEVPLDATLPVGEFVHDAIAAASLPCPGSVVGVAAGSHRARSGPGGDRRDERALVPPR